MRDLRYPKLWLFIGWFGIALLIFLSLTTLSFHTGIDYGDKLGHLLGYTLLMSWFVQLFRRWPIILLHAVILLLLGVALEFLQQRTGRTFEIADMLANTTGVTLGIVTTFTPLRNSLQWFEQRVFG